MKWNSILIALLMAAVTAQLAAEEISEALLQDFEGAYQPRVWGPARDAVISAEWKADGQKSLRIDPGVNTSFEDLKLKDWQGYSYLRFHFNNTGKQAVRLSFTIYDAKSLDQKSAGYWDWHISAIGVPPGEQTVDYELGTDLWRSETNSPYRGNHKVPIDLKNIVKFSIVNGPSVLFVDKIELIKVRQIQTEGGFAFDFASSGTPAMPQYAAVDEKCVYTAERGFGFGPGGIFKLGTSPSYPTAMLGSGLSFPQGGFRVDLPGGNYRGWIAFERGGFWAGEQSSYSNATLSVNGQTVHEHAFSPSGALFYFQDTEVTDLAKLNDLQIWPAHAISTFTFQAAKGGNTFTLQTAGVVGLPLRVAGMILAPDTADGKAFIAAHEELQRKTIAAKYPPFDRSRREGRSRPSKPIVVEPMLPGEMMYPGDRPQHEAGAALAQQFAVAGQTVTIHLGVYASKSLTVKTSAEPLKGNDGNINDVSVSYGCYLPMRSTHNGSVWLDVSHYRPQPQFSVGPDLARSLVVEYFVGADAKPGLYSVSIRLSAEGESPLDVPVKLQVMKVKLAELPIPVGICGNSLPFDTHSLDSATWWDLQEKVLKEEVVAGLNCLTGGPGLYYQVDAAGKFSGENAIRYIKTAQKYGPIKALVPYGGFVPGLNLLKADFKALAAGLQEFEEANQLPPCYVYSYDEPATDAERNAVIARLAAASQAGLKTMGYTSSHQGNQLWEKLVTNTYAPAFCIHSLKDIEWVHAAGRKFFAYNNGLDRYGMGLNLWRSIKLGVDARLNYIGFHMEGMGFYNMDGREPNYGCLMVHNKLGVLKTPQWLATREGLLDARLRLTLEQLAPKDDPVLAVWNLEGYRQDAEKWPSQALEQSRLQMLKRIAELAR